MSLTLAIVVLMGLCIGVPLGVLLTALMPLVDANRSRDGNIVRSVAESHLDLKASNANDTDGGNET